MAQSRESAKGYKNASTGRGLATVQDRMLRLLSDGQPHLRRELEDCLYEQDVTPGTVHVHLHHLRRRLREKGLEIAIQYIKGKPHYRMFRQYRPRSRGVDTGTPTGVSLT